MMPIIVGTDNLNVDYYTNWPKDIYKTERSIK